MNGFLLEDCSGLKEKPIEVNILESYKPSMSCFHAHSHYEISFILSGNVTVLCRNRSIAERSPVSFCSARLPNTI